MKHSKLLYLCSVSLVLIILITACSKKSDDKSDSTPKTKLSLQLSWIHEYSSAPFYMAVKNGHFADQGLEVELLAGGYSAADALDQVLNNQADFGTAGSPSLIEAYTDGKPVVAVANLFQRTPLALISLSTSDIKSPQDLIGKRIMVTDGSGRIITENLLAAQGIDPDSVEFISRTDYGIDPLLNNETDVLVGWLINEGVMVREAGFEPNFILVSDYGYDDYEFVIFTRQEMVNTQPDIVQKFVHGLVKGIRDVISDPAKAAQVTLTYNSDLVLAQQEARLQASLPLLNPSQSQPGMMTAEVWQRSMDSLVQQSALPAPIDLTGLYNLTFLEAAYSTR